MQYVIELLQLKKQLFLEYEQISMALTYSDIEQMEQLVDERDQLIQKIEQIESQINQTDLTHQYGKQIQNTIRVRLNRDEVPQQLIPLFDKGQEIFAIGNRIMQLEPLITQHLEDLQAELEQHIKNSNSIPKIKKYFDTIQVGLEDGSLIRSKFKKI